MLGATPGATKSPRAEAQDHFPRGRFCLYLIPVCIPLRTLASLKLFHQLSVPLLLFFRLENCSL